MSKRLSSLILASLFVFAACDREAPENPTETSVDQENSQPTGIPFGSGDHLAFEQAQNLGLTWVQALNKRDWDQLNQLFTETAVIVTHDGAVVNRVAPPVWKSQLASVTQKRDHFELDILKEFDHARLPHGAVLRSNAEVKGEVANSYSGTWDLLVRDVDGNARIVGLFERLQRSRASSAPDRYLGSSIAADGVLLEAQPTEMHGRGVHTLIDPAGLAELWVEEPALPVEWQRFKSKRFEVVDASGNKCRSEVAGFRYYSRTTVPSWLSNEWAEQSNTKQGARDAGEAAWKMGAIGGHALVAKLSPDPRIECPNPVFARMQGAGAYPVYDKTEDTVIPRGEIEKRVERSGLAINTWEYLQARGRSKPLLADESVEIRQFMNEKRRFVSLTVTGSGECNDPAANLFFLWEVKRDSWVRLNDAASSRYPFVPEYVADSNNDGSPEFYGVGMVVRESGGTFTVTEDVRPIDFSGGC